MRIVFMGTPEFAVASLDALVKNKFEIVGVVTAPDKPAGRGQTISESAVKSYSLKQGLKILQPTNLKDEFFLQELKALNADLQLVVAFRMLPEVVWNMPRMGTYNLHASLLPKYRGAAPINWAIINGEKETGITTFKLRHQIDTGDVLFFEKVIISETMNAGELHDVLMNKGAGLVVKTMNELQQNLLKGKPLNFLMQSESEACHAPKISRETCRINWNDQVKAIYNLIRGLSPYPGAFTHIKAASGEPLVIKIYIAEYEICNHKFANGYLSTDNKNVLKVYCVGGAINIKDLQIQGKKRMPVSEFLKGFKTNTGQLLGD